MAKNEELPRYKGWDMSRIIGYPATPTPNMVNSEVIPIQAQGKKYSITNQLHSTFQSSGKITGLRTVTSQETAHLTLADS